MGPARLSAVLRQMIHRRPQRPSVGDPREQLRGELADRVGTLLGSAKCRYSVSVQEVPVRARMGIHAMGPQRLVWSPIQ